MKAYKKHLILPVGIFFYELFIFILIHVETKTRIFMENVLVYNNITNIALI